VAGGAAAEPPIPEGALVLLVGPPGSGKSTLASALVATGVVDRHDVLTTDRYRARLTGDPADRGVDGRVWALLRLHLAERLAMGHTTVVDATNLHAARRARHLRVAHSFDRPVVAVRFDVPLDELLARNSRRRRVVPEGPMREMAATAAAIDDQELLAEGIDRVLGVEELLDREPALRLAAAAIATAPSPGAADVPVV